LTLDGRKLSLVRSVWWDDTGNDRVRDEIESYWEAVPANRDFRLILDVGASVGLFTLSACVRTQADIVAFEPARRQRILWRRNIQRNGFAGRARLEPVGLWDAAGQLPFRTHGALSGLQAADELLASLPFVESVPVTTLDIWRTAAGARRIDLIKMDIEGAELEALEGARETLRDDRPVLLIQAYHRRGASRTYERCARLLSAAGYRCHEVRPGGGLLYAEADR
jgi:FkbM family methyltransferase